MNNHTNLVCPNCGHRFEFFVNTEESITLTKCPKCKAWIPIMYNDDLHEFAPVPAEELKQRLEGIDYIDEIKIDEEIFESKRKHG